MTINATVLIQILVIVLILCPTYGVIGLLSASMIYRMSRKAGIWSELGAVTASLICFAVILVCLKISIVSLL